MDFNTAVERIGFPLAVLLFEDALPENAWQTATVGQCLDVRYACSQGIPKDVGGKPLPQSIWDEAGKRLEKIVAEADFKTARALCDRGNDFLKKLAYERLFSLASTFEEAYEIGHVIDLWTSSGSNDHIDPERARVTQLCFSKATRREHFAKLFNYDNYTTCRLVGRLSEENELTAIKKLIEDHPTGKELLFGYRFPSDHPYYARAVEESISRISYIADFARLYKKVVAFPKHRTRVGTEFRKRLESATLEGYHDPLPYCDTHEVATEYGDEEMAKASYSFVITNVEKLQDERFRQQGYRWIIGHSDPESDEHKKFKALIPTGRGKKQLAEV